MNPTWWSGPPPHERGLSSFEQQLRASADPHHEYCVLVRNHDLRSGRVWFTATDRRTVVGRSRVIARRRVVSGELERFNREVEAARQDLIQSLQKNGWNAADDGFHGELVFCRQRPVPDSKPSR
jgi:hypothetical protein